MTDSITENLEPEQKDNVLKLMKTFDKVKCLKLRYYTATVIRASQIELPLFCNLTRLEVELVCKNLCVLHCLLNNSYNDLQYLIIFKKARPPRCIEDEQWMEFSDVPKCLLTSLKWVEIHGFDGCTHRLDMIKNMLKCAEILKRLTIGFKRWNDREITSLRQKISTFHEHLQPVKVN